MSFNSTCIENFFDYAEEVVSYAEKIEFHKLKHSVSPGYRTDPLEKINPILCKYITCRVLSQFYDLDRIGNIEFETGTHFNSVPTESGMGITHTDKSTLTCIIFLSKNINNAGTKILKRNNFIIPNELEIQESRKKHFETDIETEEWKQNRDYLNSHYTEIMRVNSVFNTAIVFDGHNNHCMHMDYAGTNENRLTLIQFIDNTKLPDTPLLRFDKIKRTLF